MLFDQFCVALAMECIHQKHGRQFTAQCVMDDVFEVSRRYCLVIHSDARQKRGKGPLVMEQFVLQNLLDKISGCTFANLDSTTEPSNGIRKVTTGTRVILFTNKHVSGYENMVKRRLIEAGKDPDNFVLGDLPWGERIPNTPLIQNKGKLYLQCIVLAEGTSKYFIGNREVAGNGLNLRERHPNQGLPPSDRVNVACFKLESIDKITLMGQTLVADNEGVLSVAGA